MSVSFQEVEQRLRKALEQAASTQDTNKADIISAEKKSSARFFNFAVTNNVTAKDTDLLNFFPIDSEAYTRFRKSLSTAYSIIKPEISAPLFSVELYIHTWATEQAQQFYAFFNEKNDNESRIDRLTKIYLDNLKRNGHIPAPNFDLYKKLIISNYIYQFGLFLSTYVSTQLEQKENNENSIEIEIKPDEIPVSIFLAKAAGAITDPLLDAYYVADQTYLDSNTPYIQMESIESAEPIESMESNDKLSESTATPEHIPNLAPPVSLNSYIDETDELQASNAQKLIMAGEEKEEDYVQREIANIAQEREALSLALKELLEYAGLQLELTNNMYAIKVNSEGATSSEKQEIIHSIATTFVDTILNHSYYINPTEEEINSPPKEQLLTGFKQALTKVENIDKLKDFRWAFIGKFFAKIHSIIMKINVSSMQETPDNASREEEIQPQSAKLYAESLQKVNHILTPPPPTKPIPIAAY